MQKTGDRHTSQEIVQETFIRLFKNKAKAGDLSSVMAYLYVILKNKILDGHRRNLVNKKYELYISQYFDEAENSEKPTIETRELEERLQQEIERLPPKCRRVFKLSRQEYYTNKQIAASLEISENTVEQHMRRALRILRNALLAYEKILVLLILSVFK